MYELVVFDAPLPVSTSDQWQILLPVTFSHGLCADIFSDAVIKRGKVLTSVIRGVAIVPVELLTPLPLTATTAIIGRHCVARLIQHLLY